jgi:2-polyprenyl-3-methyl-5-hydroxy-6-metoxy-1,4-benzoquinol methylase
MPPDRFSFLALPDQVADWRFVVLCAAADECGLLAALPGTPGEVAAAAGLDPHAARVVLDALAEWGAVAVGEDGRYGLGPSLPEGDDLLAIHHHARALRQTSGVVTERLRGVPTERPGVRDLERWQAAMAVNARRMAPALVDACLARAPGAGRVLDLGGGHGAYGLEFVRRGLHATLQDRPEVIDMHRRRGELEAAGVELFPGDFFEVLPEGPFDIVFCAGITHTFDGEHNRRLYPRLRPLVAPGGGLAIVTLPRRSSPAASLLGVQMLVVGAGGDTHAEDEYRAWLEAAGFDMEVARFDDQPRPLIWARPR